MKTTIELDQQRINQKFVQLAKKYKMNPVWLREILNLHNQGYNYTEIANRTGISRHTVAEYLQKMRQMNRKDYASLIVGAFFLVVGIAIIIDFFKKD